MKLRIKAQRVLAALLMLVMLCSSLAACSPAGSTETDAPTTTDAPKATDAPEATDATEAPEVTEPVEIVIRLYETGDLMPEEKRNEVLEAINAYIEPKINVRIKHIYWNNDGTKLDLQLGAGEDVDLWWTNKNTYALQGAAYDITEKIKNYPDLYNLIPESVWEALKVNGKNYHIPIYKEFATGYGVLIPADYIDQHGWDLEAAETIADIEPWLEDMYQDGVDFPFVNSFNMLKPFLYQDYAFVNNYLVVDRDGDTTKIQNVFETDEMYDLLELFHSWNQKGYISQELATSVPSATMNEYKKAREVGVMHWLTTPDNVANANRSKGIPDVGLTYDVFTFSDAYIDTGAGLGSAYQLNAKSPEEEIDACLKFIELLYTDPDKVVGDLLCWGIEGKDYNLVNNQVEKIDGTKWVTGGVWSLTAVDGAHWVTGTVENLPELYEEFNAEAKISVTNGFFFDQTKVEAEIAACDAVHSEYLYLLSHGFYNPEEYVPLIREKMKEAGIDKVVAECQAQYDAWLKSK